MPFPYQPVTLTAEQVREWLGGPRFGRYLTATGGHAGRALALYEWNSHLAAAALVDVGHFEVALRNAYDTQLSAAYPNWATDPGSALFARVVGPAKVRPAQQRLNRGSLERLAAARAGLGGHPTHGQVLAALDFGFWVALSKKERTDTFWTPMLSRAYPTHLSRGRVHQLVDNLRKFRNRLAHNEPVFSTRTGLAARMLELDTVFSWIRPQAAAWVRQRSMVPRLATACPVAGLTPSVGAHAAVSNSIPPPTP